MTTMTGTQLYLARTQAGVTQAKLALMVGVSVRTIRRWEADHVKIGKPEEMAIEQVIRSLSLVSR